LRKLERERYGWRVYSFDGLSGSREIPRDKYFASVLLPGGKGTGPFMKWGFEKAVQNVISGWKVLYEGVTRGKDVSVFFKNWDLDTGIDQDTGKRTFWV
jgi:hypothetical protein